MGHINGQGTDHEDKMTSETVGEDTPEDNLCQRDGPGGKSAGICPYFKKRGVSMGGKRTAMGHGECLSDD